MRSLFAVLLVVSATSAWAGEGDLEAPFSGLKISKKKVEELAPLTTGETEAYLEKDGVLIVRAPWTEKEIPKLDVPKLTKADAEQLQQLMKAVSLAGPKQPAAGWRVGNAYAMLLPAHTARVANDGRIQAIGESASPKLLIDSGTDPRVFKDERRKEVLVHEYLHLLLFQADPDEKYEEKSGKKYRVRDLKLAAAKLQYGEAIREFRSAVQAEEKERIGFLKKGAVAWASAKNDLVANDVFQIQAELDVYSLQLALTDTFRMPKTSQSEVAEAVEQYRVLLVSLEEKWKTDPIYKQVKLVEKFLEADAQKKLTEYADRLDAVRTLADRVKKFLKEERVNALLSETTRRALNK